MKKFFVNEKIIVVGNSLSSGFQFVPENVENKEIYSLSMYLNYYLYESLILPFTRPKSNNGKEICTWFNKNLTIGEMMKIAETDVQEMSRGSKYISLDLSDKIKNSSILDILNKNNPIIWINTMTGAVIDQITRGGSVLSLISAFKTDLYYTKQLIEQIYLINPRAIIYINSLPMINCSMADCFRFAKFMDIQYKNPEEGIKYVTAKNENIVLSKIKLTYLLNSILKFTNR